MIIGIDPGINGALAFLDGDSTEVLDLPKVAKSSGKGNEINPYELWSMLTKYPPGVPVYLEKVHAGVFGGRPGRRCPLCKQMRKQSMGAVSAFGFGDTFGCIRSVCACTGNPLHLVAPPTWKKAFGLIGVDKDRPRTLALQRFPALSGELKRKKDLDRAHALLIALYGQMEGSS